MENCGKGRWTDRIEDLKYSFNHKPEVLNLEITSTLNQGSHDESFGFNNVEIFVCNDEEGDCET